MPSGSGRGRRERERRVDPGRKPGAILGDQISGALTRGSEDGEETPEAPSAGPGWRRAPHVVSSSTAADVCCVCVYLVAYAWIYVDIFILFIHIYIYYICIYIFIYFIYLYILFLYILYLYIGLAICEGLQRMTRCPVDIANWKVSNLRSGDFVFIFYICIMHTIKHCHLFKKKDKSSVCGQSRWIVRHLKRQLMNPMNWLFPVTRHLFTQ